MSFLKASAMSFLAIDALRLHLRVKSKVKGFVVRIGQVAQELGVSTDTIRFYEKRGLINSDRRPNGYRDFAPGTVQFLKMIRLAQQLGFTLREISDLTAALQDDTFAAQQVGALLQSKIDELETKAANILSLRDILKTRLNDVCPLGLHPNA
jgi:DNA-binding transcriptional MerR regulator